MRSMPSEYDKNLARKIKAVKKAISNLEVLGLKIEIQKTETIFGKEILHVYARDYMAERVILQKHLFSMEVNT